MAGNAHAEQRALLIGVGEYELDGMDLPGIDIDLDRMEDTLRVIGFKDTQIKRLLNADATAENVIDHFGTWLTDGVGPDDRVVVYFSGHGSFIPDENGDEPDGVDEVLVTHNVRYASIDGKRSLVGIVKDDDVAAMIRGTASNNVLVIVDACHSGTMTRDILMRNRSLTGEPVFERSFAWDGMPIGRDPGMTRDIANAKTAADREFESKFIGISAAGDGEKAIGTSRGGVFTIGFTDAILNGARDGRQLDIQAVRDSAERFIRQKLDSNRAHTPQITGNSALGDGLLPIAPITEGYGPIWTRLQELTGEGQFFALSSEKREYRVDDAVEISLDIPESGYLNLVTVDAHDNATVLFPNEFESNNYVEAGQFSFPSDAAEFEFAAAQPAGPTLMVAFVTKHSVNFRELGYEGRLDDGNFSEDAIFTTVSYAATRAIKVRRKTDATDDSSGSSNAAAAGAEVAAAAADTVTTADDSIESTPSVYASSLVLIVNEPK